MLIGKVRRGLTGLSRRVTPPRLLQRFPMLADLDDDLNHCDRMREHVYLTSRYCIKTCEPHMEFLIKNEASALAKLGSSLHVPRLVKLVDEPGSVVLVSERIPGVDLAAYYKLDSHQREVFVRGAATICSDLDQAGIQHRDVLPRNLMMTDDRLYLIDFEFACDTANPLLGSSAEEEAFLAECLAGIRGDLWAPDDRAAFDQLLSIYDRRKGVGSRLRYVGARTKRLLRT